MPYITLLMTAIFFHAAVALNAAATDPRQVLSTMIAQINQAKSLSYTFKKKERVQHGFSTAEQDIKLLVEPMKAHIYVHRPNKGTVAVWSQNENNGAVQVSPGWLPFITVNLSPESDELRNNNHHSIRNVGFDFLADIVQNILRKYESSLSEILHYGGLHLVNNRLCHKVTIDFKEYKYSSYTIKPNENLMQVAAKLKVNEFMLLLNNPAIKSLKAVKAGQTIRVPMEYAKTTELYIDKENMMPIVQKMHDEKGLFEHYEFLNLQYNPSLNDNLFLTSAN